MDDSQAALAAEFVQVCKTAGITLDFQPRTLPFVDKYLTGSRAEAQAKVPSIGAYVGEVIRRETGGVWYEHEGNPALDCGEHQIDPLAFINLMIEKGNAQFGDVKIAGTKQYCEWVCRMQRQWLDGTLLGSYESMAALRTSMTPDAKLAGVIVAQAQGAVKTAKLKWQESLDFTQDSLEGVERILGKIHNAGLYGSGSAKPSEEELAVLSKMWGTYIGEVIRRHYGGQWSQGEDGTLSLSIGEAKGVFPIAKARKRVVDGAGDNIRYYFSSMVKLIQG
jgi:hypothetical protein